MAYGFLLEFSGFGEDRYLAVSEKLGINQKTGEGDWPQGMRFHAAGASDGGWAVYEVWESKEAQGRFFEERLSKALAEAGVTDPPSRADWFELTSLHDLPG